MLRTTALWIALASTILLSASARGQEEARDWDALFERTEGWLGADGVYSLDLGSRRDAEPLYLWHFSDTFAGATKDEGREFASRQMVNHSFALLKGTNPNPDKIAFYCDADPETKRAENFLPGKYWLQAAILLDDKVWISAILVGEGWKPARVDAATIPLDPETRRPDFSRAQVDADVPLSLKTDDAQLVWGAAILDEPNAPFVYVYGYVDRLREKSRKDMVVARVPKENFERVDAWEYYDGSDWTQDPLAVLTPEATLVRRVSTEFSVSKIPSGPARGDYLLVYTPGVIGPSVAYRVGKSPLGPFGEERVFYRSSVPRELPGVRCYNAKAHPAFSDENGILVSYNVNRLGDMARKPAEYRPRFLRLSWETIGAPRSSRNSSGN